MVHFGEKIRKKLKMIIAKLNLACISYACIFSILKLNVVSNYM